jgi:DNA polymerase (family 10)
MIPENERIAEFLRRKGAEYPPAEVYRRQAYERAAARVASLQESILNYHEQDILRDLPGVGSSIEEAIKDAIKKGIHLKGQKPQGGRFPRQKLQTLVDDVLQALGPLCDNIVCAGSWRRERPTVKDLDFLVAAHVDVSTDIMDAFITYADADPLWTGPDKTTVIISHAVGNVQMDLRRVLSEQWGSALLYFTGSAQFNITMRAFVKSKGLLLNEYGLYEKGDIEPFVSVTEEDIFDALGLPWVHPKQREAWPF